MRIDAPEATILIYARIIVVARHSNRTEVEWLHLWFWFLRVSPNCDLTRRFRAGELSADDALPVDLDRVLAIYDDLGDVQTTGVVQWWRNVGLPYFGYEGGKTIAVEHGGPTLHLIVIGRHDLKVVARGIGPAKNYLIVGTLLVLKVGAEPRIYDGADGISHGSIPFRWGPEHSYLDALDADILRIGSDRTFEDRDYFSGLSRPGIAGGHRA